MSGWEIVHVVADLVVGVFAVVVFFRPQPALHKQFADKSETEKKIDQLKVERREDVSEIKAGIREINDRFVALCGEQSQSRKLMYSRINVHGNALYFLAGKMSARGEKDGEHIRTILRRAEETES